LALPRTGLRSNSKGSISAAIAFGFRFAFDASAGASATSGLRVIGMKLLESGLDGVKNDCALACEASTIAKITKLMRMAFKLTFVNL
jgi:hypothetical protein